MPSREPISTVRLRLDPVSVAEAESIVAGDLSLVDAGAGWPHPDTMIVLRLAVELGAELGWFIVLDGAVIGECGTQGPPERGQVEIGYGLASPFRGKGLATEACAALSGWLLAQPDVTHVTARTHPVANPASRRVLEKAGFVLDHCDDTIAWYRRDAPGAHGADGGVK